MSNFLERILQRSQYNRRISNIKPAVTPEMIPEIFILPSQKVSHSPLYITSQITKSKAIEKEKELDRSPKIETRSTSPSPHHSSFLNNPESEELELDGNTQSDNSKAYNPSIIRNTENNIESKDKIHHKEYPSDVHTTQIRDTKLENTAIIPSISEQAILEKKEQVDTAKKTLKMNQIKQNIRGTKQQTNSDLLFSESSITINIDKIEVRAIIPDKPVKTINPIPTLSLEDYLKQRKEAT